MQGTEEGEGRELAAATLASNPQAPARPMSASERASARAKELRLQVENKPIGSPPKTPASAKQPGANGKIYTPDEKNLWGKTKNGTPVKLGGTLREVKRSSTGKSIYLLFADYADKGKLAGVAHKGSFKGDFREEAFRPYIGKKIVLTGICFKEPGGRFLAKIQRMNQIKVTK